MSLGNPYTSDVIADRLSLVSQHTRIGEAVERATQELNHVLRPGERITKEGVQFARQTLRTALTADLAEDKESQL